MKAARFALPFRDDMMAFFNSWSDDLGGRPLDLAINSDAGLAQVERALQSLVQSDALDERSIRRNVMTTSPEEREQPSNDDTARRPFNPDGGEDEASVEDGNGDVVRDDQKPLNGAPSRLVDGKPDDDAHKTEDLTKAGRKEFDPNAGQE